MHRTIIVAVGNELLIGETLDTNTNWLCRHLTALGFKIEATLTLPDKIDVISKTIKSIINDNWIVFSPELLIITGGLGPTEDDLTLASIAQALDTALEIDKTAYDWVKEKYQNLAKESLVSSSEMNPARDKMARLPKGATPIKNTVGVAPAIKITYKNTTIISLPGVPQEMKGFMLGEVQTILSEQFSVGAHIEKELWALCGDESILAPILSKVSEKHPEVYIKSKAKGFEQNLRFQIKLHITGQNIVIDEKLKAAIEDLEKNLNEHNIKLDKS